MEGFIVDPRQSGPEEFQRGMRDVKLVFAINHTMPYTEEYDALVNELFAGKIGEGSRVLPPLNLVCAEQVTLGSNVLVMGGSHGEILRDPVINEIAKAHGKSAAQVIIRWHIQKGFCVVPGSSNPKHIQENIEVFDFELSQEEMAKMASLNQEKRYFNMTYQQIKDWMENYELWD